MVFFGDGMVPASLWSGIFLFYYFFVCVSVMVMYDVISFHFGRCLLNVFVYTIVDVNL